MATSEVIQDDVLLYYMENSLALFTNGLRKGTLTWCEPRGTHMYMYMDMYSSTHS